MHMYIKNVWKVTSKTESKVGVETAYQHIDTCTLDSCTNTECLWMRGSVV